MSNNRIFIFEFVSGGGFNQVDIPNSLFCEGYGMLKSIITDFKALNFEISTLLDNRISFLTSHLDANKVSYVKAKDDYINIFKKALVDCENAFIIAPEFSDILYNLTKIVKDYKKQILSIDLKGIQLGASKIKTYEYFRKNNIKTPETYQIPLVDGLDMDFILKKFNELKTPIIIKPEDGVGAESIYYFKNRNQIQSFFKELNYNIDLNRRYILQKYIDGRDLSVSLIGAPYNSNNLSIPPKILSINFQDVNIKESAIQSGYFGGYTPVKNYAQINKTLSNIFNKLDLSMFNSYFGIDFIKNEDLISFIEINPRLTTSYIGIRNILNINPAEIIINNFSNSPEFQTIQINKHSIFTRLELRYKGELSLIEIRETVIPKLLKRIPEFVTPPISFNISNQKDQFFFSCFIATKEYDLYNSRKRLNIIKDILKKEYNFEVIK